MSFCCSCRTALWRDSRLRRAFSITRHLSTKPSTAETILAQPSWSVRSLTSDTIPAEEISQKQLHHLLRLSALPLPKSEAEEASMIRTLQSQLRFVHAVQKVDTDGIAPLRAIRDETEEGLREQAVDLEDLKDVLAKEILVGHYKRQRRIKEKVEEEAEKWDVLGTASKTAGRFFVVESGKREEKSP